VPETTLYRVALLDMQSMASVSVAWPKCVISGSPAFSFAGHNLAFACTPTWGITDIYVSSEIGSVPRRVSRILGEPTGITWTKNDRSLIVGMTRGRADLWRVDKASGKAEPLLFGSHATSPTVAPRGDLLAFTQKTETSNIWRMDLADRSKSTHRFIASTRFEQNPKYSPDGNYVLFESSRSGFSEIWMSRSDGSDVLQLTHFEGPLTGSPHWAPDSRHFVFDSRDAGESNLYIMDINERVPRRVAIDVTDNSTPSWSHDRQWIYFRGDVPGKGGIYKVPPQGGRATLLSLSERFDPVESLNGSDVYFAVGYKMNVIHRMSLKTGVDSTVTALPAHGELLAWTPAPHGLYFLKQLESGNAALCFFNSTDGRVRTIVELPKEKRPTPMLGGLSLSPDQRSLLYSQIDELQSDIFLVENFQ